MENLVRVENVEVNFLDGDADKDNEEYTSCDDTSVRDINFENNVNGKNDDDYFKNYVNAKVIHIINNLA